MINIVVALLSEARPVIKHYGLVLQPEWRGFPVYAGNGLRLVVSGVGKVLAAAATAFLAGAARAEHGPWLNIGIAGHSSLPIGAITFASKITDRVSGRNWYPPQVVKMPGTGVHVATHDQPVLHYPESVACDMEAAAFYVSATRFVSGELAQCCKIISDNAQSHIDHITPNFVADLIGDNLHEIDNAVQALRSLVEAADHIHVDAIDVNQYSARWHFTTAQKVQLQETLRKALVRGSAEMLDAEQWHYCHNAKNVLAEIDRYLKSLPVTL